MSDEKKPVPIEETNWLTHPAYWDLCDEHETTFPMGDHCPKCGPRPPHKANASQER